MKIAVSFANIFMADKKVIQQSETEPKEWKRYIDDVFSFWDCDRKDVNRFVKRASYFHPTIKFTAEISEDQPNPFSRYHGVQRGRIRKKFRLGHQNSLEADRDFLNYALRLVPPTRIHNQPFLKTNFTKPPIIFYKKEKIFRTVLWKQKYNLKARGNAARPRKPHEESVLVYLYPYSHIVSLQLIACIYFSILSAVNSSS